MAAVETTGIVRGPVRTYSASAANQKRGIALVQGAADNLAAPAAAANAVVIGFQAEDTIAAGDAVPVAREGEAVAIAGAAIAAGQYLITNAAGQVVPTAAAGDQICARAISSAAVAGDFLVVFITPFIR